MVAQTSCARSEPRTNMFVMAAISASTASGPVRIRNLSPSGALIEAKALPMPGELVMLRRGEDSISGKVVWTEAGKAGLHFEAKVHVAKWLPGGQSAQQQVDETFQQIKDAAHVSPPAPRTAPLHSQMPSALDFRRLARAIDALADDLADDPAVVARYGTRLQALDIAGQALRKVADCDV